MTVQRSYCDLARRAYIVPTSKFFIEYLGTTYLNYIIDIINLPLLLYLLIHLFNTHVVRLLVVVFFNLYGLEIIIYTAVKLILLIRHLIKSTVADFQPILVTLHLSKHLSIFLTPVPTNPIKLGTILTLLMLKQCFRVHYIMKRELTHNTNTIKNCTAF